MELQFQLFYHCYNIRVCNNLGNALLFGNIQTF